jgi:hypothetical protein
MMTWFGLLLLSMTVAGVTADVVEHRRLNRTGVKPRVEGPFK